MGECFFLLPFSAAFLKDGDMIPGWHCVGQFVAFTCCLCAGKIHTYMPSLTVLDGATRPKMRVHNRCRIFLWRGRRMMFLDGKSTRYHLDGPFWEFRTTYTYIFTLTFNTHRRNTYIVIISQTLSCSCKNLSLSSSHQVKITPIRRNISADMI